MQLLLQNSKYFIIFFCQVGSHQDPGLAHWLIALSLSFKFIGGYLGVQPPCRGHDPAQPHLFYLFRIHPGKDQGLHPYAWNTHVNQMRVCVDGTVNLCCAICKLFAYHSLRTEICRFLRKHKGNGGARCPVFTSGSQKINLLRT